MSTPKDTDAADRLAPVELLVIEFPGGEISGPGFATLTALVERGVITVLDLEFVRRAGDGAPESVSIEDAVDGAAVDLGYLVGAASGLLDTDDVAAVGELIEPGSLAGILLFEHVWMLPMVDALHAGGAKVLSSVRVAPADLEAALDRLDGSGTTPNDGQVA